MTARPQIPSVYPRLLAMWAAVCTVSAAPSFLLAMDEYDVPAMVLGVACFIVGLTLCTSTARFQRFRRWPFVRRTLYLGYGLRMGVSVWVPAGFICDVAPGIVSIEAVSHLPLEQHGFLATLLITLVQGTLLNAIVVAFMLLVYGVQRVFLQAPAVNPVACEHCAYDLRGCGHADRCPECGHLIAAHVHCAIRSGPSVGVGHT